MRASSSEDIFLPTGLGFYSQLDQARTVGLVKIESGASLDLDGFNLTLGGDFRNDGAFTANNGTITLSGTATQTIKGTSSTSFYNLTINNSSANVELRQNATVNNTLTMTSGHIALDDYNLTIGSSGSISGFASTQFIVTDGTGDLCQQGIGPGGRTGNIVFPVGISTTSYTPVTINNIGTLDEYCIQACDNVFEEGNCGSGTQITSESVDKTWLVNETVATGSNVTLIIQWNGVDELTSFDRTDMFISHHTGSFWDRLESGISASGSDPYTASTSGVSVFSPFGARSGSSPLPIELIAFKAQVVEKQVRLTWETASERDNDFFTVERSRNARNFEIVSTIDAVGNSQEKQVYSLIYGQPNEGTSYYRLKQTDFDGSFTYSNVVFVQFDKYIQDALIIFPNPANGNEFTAKLQEFVLDSETTIEIMDINGKTLYLFQPEMSKENNHSEIAIKNLNLSPGIYIVSVYSFVSSSNKCNFPL